jgi:lauroyl/myristoyl acyltransferase
LKRSDLTNKLEFGLFLFVIRLLRIPPYSFSTRLVTRLFLFGRHFGKRRRLAELHLSKVFPEISASRRKQLLKGVYTNMALTTCELYLKQEQQLISHFGLMDRRYLDAALSLGKGAIMATAHIGNWEAARLIPLFGIPFSVVIKQQHNPYFNDFNNAIRTRQGVTLIDFRNSLRDMLTKLKHNETVGILVDQNAGSSGLVLDFLGFPASHWRGVAKISLRYKVPIVPAFAIRTKDGKIVVCIEPMIYHPELEDKEENYPLILKEVNTAVEKYIRRYPEQWFWVHNRWKATGAMNSN